MIPIAHRSTIRCGRKRDDFVSSVLACVDALEARARFCNSNIVVDLWTKRAAWTDAQLPGTLPTSRSPSAVSYTHLTLPTICSV